ncbi:MAG: type I-E CRISPR-associated protein Cse1/CasA [Pigmentiphaga sp.]|uniref:type I-E CRISPR-associated protein Cse1/CasA n=1 Tax=Pigmentiphaga sp. TaxID=1977564 RepID=UPI0029A7C42F|nr:type I-E CRISPR-associated protein Cse1/CasA [Pigmentiphaga sp.]MDX3905105.1 type I-E CRISPR-associated protein Cse1/CasA [Pigmentiphaga sp.]
MDKSFSLLDEEWLPVRFGDGTVVRLGLKEVFARSREIVALAETAPPSLVAQYRLLLAIVHRALTQARERWGDEDRADWHAEGLPLSDIHAYLERWRDRFWLFHPEVPFLQVPALASAPETRDKRKPWTQIALASANGNTPVVFDHAWDGDPVTITAADAVCTLLGFLQFTPAGLVKSLRDSDKAGALVNTAAVVPLGPNLASTLCLALHPAPTAHAEPDLPAWEREPLTTDQIRAEPVLATGPNDRYTRQSRAVLLVRENDGGVRWLHFGAGQALGEDPHAPDPMASYRAGSNGLVRLTFTEGRAIWRDLPALVPDQGSGGQPAAVLNYAINLHLADATRPPHQLLLIAGVASDQAKILRWRADSIVLPSELLINPDKAQQLGSLLRAAESLFSDARRLATWMLAHALPDSKSKDTQGRARALLEAGPFAATYFATMERALPGALRELGEGAIGDASDWHQAMRGAALRAWNEVLICLGQSARALRADGEYTPRFHALLNKWCPKPQVALSEEV